MNHFSKADIALVVAVSERGASTCQLFRRWLLPVAFPPFAQLAKTIHQGTCLDRAREDCPDACLEHLLAILRGDHGTPEDYGYVHAALPQLLDQLRHEGHVFPGMTANADDIGVARDRLVGDGGGRVQFAEILDLHLRLAQYARYGDRSVLVLVDPHNGERNRLTRHRGPPRSSPAGDDRTRRAASRVRCA